MAEATIDQLQIDIQTSSTNAVSGLNLLTESLTRLRTAVKGGIGLTTASKQLQMFSQSLQTMQAPGQKVASLVAALKPLETIGKSNLGSALNQLRKIPEITAGLDDTKLTAFASKIIQVTNAIRPLAIEMEKVSAGFSRLPANIQRAINANAKLTTSNHKTSKSYGVLGTGISSAMAKMTVAYFIVRRIAGVIGDWINESNAYIENLNLFTVAMGEFAKESQAYAEHVGEVMGIDPSAWMRNQGIFMTLATGFGVTADKAALMSKNLVQLGYDLSSFFNISVEDSMQKLQSGLAGELEPLRRLGYDLSQARLEQIALSLGIKKSVANMNQAEKSQLRYYAILTQVTTAQGDMARTLQAPANQLRILKAQATQAARALGNIFIPALNAVLPYAIAFLKVIRTIANEIATLFNFSLPEVDYSGVQSIGEDAEEANEDVKELKNTLLGFDELNILNTSANGVLATSGNVLDFTLPEYDFLGDLIENKSDALAKKFEQPFKDALKLVGLIGAALLAWKIATGVMNTIAWMKGLSNGGMIALGITLSLIGFTIAASGFKAIGKGEAELMDYIKAALGSALGIVGSLIAFGTGPVGWIIGISAAVVVAIVGISVGAKEKVSETVQEAFYGYDDGAISITDLSDAFSTLMQAIINTNQPIIDNGKLIDNAKEKVNKAVESIDGIRKGIELGVYTADEKIPKLVAAFTELETGTKSILDSVYENIVSAISGSLNQALIDANSDIPQIIAIIAGVKGEVDKTFESITKDFNDAKDAFDDGNISAQDYSTAIYALTQDIKKLVGETDPVAEAFATITDALGGINWGDETAKNNAFAIISESADNAKTAVDEAYKTIKDNVSSMRGWSDDPTFQLQLDKIILGNEATRNSQLASIQTNLATVFDSVQKDLIAKGATVAENAAAEWDKMGWFAKLVQGGSKDTFIYKNLYDYMENTIRPVLDEFGITEGRYAEETMQKLLTEMFDYSNYDTGIVKLKSSLTLDAQEMLESFGIDSAVFAKSAGMNIAVGLRKGLSDEMDASVTAFKTAALTPSKIFKSENQIESPSKLFESHGKNIIQGLWDGMKLIWNDLITWWENLKLPEIEFKMPHFEWSTVPAPEWLAKILSALGLPTQLPKLNVEWYENGGYPTSGDLFFANENGSPEMVGSMGGRTAVANNDQIVAGIASGVASANSEQNALLREQNKLLRQLIDQDKVVVFPTSAEAGRAVSKSIGMYDKARGVV